MDRDDSIRCPTGKCPSALLNSQDPLSLIIPDISLRVHFTDVRILALARRQQQVPSSSRTLFLSVRFVLDSRESCTSTPSSKDADDKSQYTREPERRMVATTTRDLSWTKNLWALIGRVELRQQWYHKLYNHVSTEATVFGVGKR
jgi:hypothetical protein